MYYEHVNRQPRARERSQTLPLNQSRRVRRENYAVYGARKMCLELNRESHPVARCAVQPLILAAGLGGVIRGQVKRTTIPERLPREPGTWSAGDAAPARAEHPGGRGHAPTHPPGQGGCTQPFRH